MTWLEYFRMVLEWISLEISALPHSDFLRRVRAQAADFWRRTQRLALAIIIIPVIVFVAGIFFHSRPTIAIAGLLATVCWGTILFAFASIAELITAVYREVRGLGGEALGRIYLKAVATILLGEMLVVGYAIIVPVWNNPGAIPIVAMMAILLATMIAVWKMQYNVFHQIAFWIAVAAFVFFTASFFLPNTFAVLDERAPEIDKNLSIWARNPSASPILIVIGIIALVILLIYFLGKVAPAGSKLLKSAIALVAAVAAIYFLWPYAKALAGKTFGEKLPALEPYIGKFDSSKTNVVLEESLSPRAPFDRKYDLPRIIKKGDIIAVEVSGNYIWDPAADGYIGPCGASWTPKQLHYKAKFPILDYGIAGVVLKIGDGGYIGLCGSGQRTFDDRGTVLATFRALEDSGSLTIAINERWDSAAYADNSGNISVRAWLIN
ncbi:hypothetical protein EPN15_04485 [Patescibacteria group bacterium]|nr:MAG: hypothetical protein EPN15_04485 [Patescibacteria group bacterium]